jgi:glycosyltransferase involved in cell wall biosynthesis
MRIVYFTIDNINDNVILAQTFPLLGRLAGLPGVEGVDLFAMQKHGGEGYRSSLPATVRVQIGRNRGIWHPLTLLHLARLSLAAWVRARPGTVLIGRNPVSVLCLGLAALRCRTRLVLDYRGILSEEYVLQGKINRRGRMHRWLRGLERWALRRADGVLCVSERLRRRTRGWQPEAAKKLVVVPCCYDPRLAQQDAALVEQLRAELGLDRTQDFVLVYAGSLSAWNRPEAVLAAHRAFRSVQERTRLLLLTGNLYEAESMFGEEPGVLVRSVPHEDVQHYLALADLGLLLRGRSPVNRVASPVKFAEYLVCGVPVLVSPGVGDCPRIVRTERVGYVFGEGLPLERVASEIRAHRAELHVRCREVAARYFDGDRYAGSYRELFAGSAR